MPRRLSSWLLLGAALLLSHSASAAHWETLVMPGKVIQGHAKYEEECDRCHAKLKNTDQTTLCLDCHKKVAEDIEQKSGLHGLSQRIRTARCKSCHSDHLGRSADIVHLDRDNFDHTGTDFKLKGRHLSLTCNSCHRPKKRFREAPATCIGCHKKSDPHKGRLGKKCNKCHSSDGWQKTTFDHNKTDFKLKGKHKKATCIACHVNQRYKNLATTCHACHQLDDVHNGSWGRKCQNCHQEKSWDKTHYDHNKTKFKLTGQHKEANCFSCHIDNKKGKDLGKKCYDCHKQDDDHNGRYGRKCKSCHTPQSWEKQKFDHDKTDFKLRGRHKKTQCRACHKGRVVDEQIETSCYSCHKRDDVHKGNEGKQCQRCHNEADWNKRVLFDHDISHFPLIGLHAITPCEECHLSNDFRAAKSACIDCHKDDDEHKARLGPNCLSCHTPNGWGLWMFDHDEQTDYPLKGKHKNLSCLACHTRAVEKKIRLSSACAHCHARDDAHHGEFGRYCERCHSTESFDEIVLQR